MKEGFTGPIRSMDTNQNYCGAFSLIVNAFLVVNTIKPSICLNVELSKSICLDTFNKNFTICENMLQIYQPADLESENRQRPLFYLFD